MKQKIGSLIDSAGVGVCLAPGDMITDVVVIAKVVTGDGSVGVAMEVSEACSWLDTLGLMTAGFSIMRASSPLMRDERD